MAAAVSEGIRHLLATLKLAQASNLKGRLHPRLFYGLIIASVSIGVLMVVLSLTPERRAKRLFSGACQSALSLQEEKHGRVGERKLYADAREKIERLLRTLPTTSTAIALQAGELTVSGIHVDQFLAWLGFLDALDTVESDPLSCATVLIRSPKVNGFNQTWWLCDIAQAYAERERRTIRPRLFC